MAQAGKGAYEGRESCVEGPDRPGRRYLPVITIGHPMTRTAIVTVLAASCLAMAAPASARSVHHHHHYYHHHYFHHHHVLRERYDPGYHDQVIGHTRSGDAIISGGIGFHRSDFGVMVPDSDGPNFIQSGF